MKFRIEQRAPHREIHTPDAQLAKKFSDLLKTELGDLLKSVLLFGSIARQENPTYEPDIDILVLLDDTTIVFSTEVIEAYRVITQQTAGLVTNRLHITTMRLTNFWDHLRNGDPIVVNMLRDGIALYDTGIVKPAQQLLHDGRIKPTQESIYAYFARAPTTLTNADWHIMQACMDLYWAVIDSAHAALMSKGHVAPSPRHVSDFLTRTLVSGGITHKKYAATMDFFYDLNKNILHRNVTRIPGKDYDDYHVRAKDFVREMQRIVEGR